MVLYAANIPIVTAAIAASGSEIGYFKLIRSNVRATIIPFTLMASTALMLVILWQRTAFLFAALVGPLVAISLYQRSTHRALNAIRLALTDPLTGLGNHRHFHERLQRELATAEESNGLVSLCFLDVDDFKRVNDQFGHPAGDRVLSQVAGRLRQGGEAFRLGGDEFAVLLPGSDERTALSTAASIIERIGESDLGDIGAITVSAGVATFPQHGRERDSLIRLADGALYWAKEHGKNQVRVAPSDVVELSEFRRVAGGADRAAASAPPPPSRARSTRATRTPAATRSASQQLAGAIAEPARPAARARSSDAPRRRACTTSASWPPGRDPPQAVRPLERGVARRSSAIRRSGSGCSRASASTRSPTGSCITTSAGTERATRRSRGRGHPAWFAHHLRRGRVRRDDLQPAVPHAGDARRGAGRDRALRGSPVRPRRACARSSLSLAPRAVRALARAVRLRGAGRSPSGRCRAAPV